jgi:hypothetical protein
MPAPPDAGSVSGRHREGVAGPLVSFFTVQVRGSEVQVTFWPRAIGSTVAFQLHSPLSAGQHPAFPFVATICS